MKEKVREWRTDHKPKPLIGTEIGSQDPTTPIKVMENTQPNKTGFVVRIFHRSSENEWFASTTITTTGLVVYINKKPLLGQKIQITGMYERYATGIVTTPKLKRK